MLEDIKLELHQLLYSDTKVDELLLVLLDDWITFPLIINGYEVLFKVVYKSMISVVVSNNPWPNAAISSCTTNTSSHTDLYMIAYS